MGDELGGTALVSEAMLGEAEEKAQEAVF